MQRARTCLLALPVQLKRGPGGFRLQPEEAGKALIDPVARHAATTGLQREYRLRGVPGQPDRLGKDDQLFRLTLNQRALDQPDRKVAHQGEGDGGLVEIPPARIRQQPRLVELAERMQRLHHRQRLRMLA